MTVIIFDTPKVRRQLYPLSLTRPVAQIRHGIFTPQEWYQYFWGAAVFPLSAAYLQSAIPSDDCYLCIDAAVVPDADLAAHIYQLQPGSMLQDADGLIAYATTSVPAYGSLPLFFKDTITLPNPAMRIKHPMDWVLTNMHKLKRDLALVQLQPPGQANRHDNQVFGSNPVWVDTGAVVRGAIFNTDDGPVFIGKNAQVLEGCLIKGPVYIGDGAVVKMGTQLYPGTTIGRNATAGGEIKNSILGDYSNKAHHGYLGDSMTGQWCNLGAGTSNSNVKNNASVVHMWSQAVQQYIPIGKKAGVIMGDFSKTAIQTTINTGTTVGVCCSIHHAGFTDKHIPSFTWGAAEKYDLDKALRDIAHWFAFKQYTPEPHWQMVIQHLFKQENTA